MDFHKIYTRLIKTNLLGKIFIIPIILQYFLEDKFKFREMPKVFLSLLNKVSFGPVLKKMLMEKTLKFRLHNISKFSE